jgi:hypothetical protein
MLNNRVVSSGRIRCICQYRLLSGRRIQQQQKHPNHSMSFHADRLIDFHRLTSTVLSVMIRDMATGLFKYFPTNTEKLRWFTGGQLLLTPPEFFNDPWDFRVRFAPWSDAELRRECPFSSSLSMEDFNKFREAMTNADFQADESRNYQKKIGKIVGVVSLAENPLDRCMWAHYAESHRGFVAEFGHADEETKDGFRLRGGPFGPAAKVRYLTPNERQPECKRDGSNIEQILWTKHSKWNYEQEWRVVQSHSKATRGLASDGTPRSLLKFGPNDLIRVIFGLHICPIVEAKLREMLNQPEFGNVRKERADIDPITNKLISRELR